MSLSQMKVELIDCMGDDLMVVNAARVSFNKESDYEIVGDIHSDEWAFKVPEADERLIRYLAKHKHWTPFSHPQISLRVRAPIFVARQLFKHKVGMTENEVSRRYVDDKPEFLIPREWRGKPTDGAKQGSSGIVSHWHSGYIKFLKKAEKLYEEMLEEGIAPEQARMVLPQSMFTEWYWTGSLFAFSRICNLRLDSHAQSETREIAERINKIVTPLFPISWKNLVSGE